MRISPELTQKLQELSTQRTRRSSDASPSAQAEGADSSDKQAEALQLSPALRLIQSLYEQVANLPEVDVKKVRQVAEQLRNGNYNVEAQSVAEAVLQELSHR